MITGRGFKRVRAVRASIEGRAEIERMNATLFEELRTAKDPIRLYRDYLNQRNASYMQLEAGSAFDGRADGADPFETATGYHRIAIPDPCTKALSSPD